MKRISALLAVAVLAAASRVDAAAGGEADGTASSARDAGVVVDRMVAEGVAVAWTPARDRPLLAPATGGLVGWLMPQLYLWYPGLDGEMGEIGQDALRFDEDLGLSDSELSVLPAIQVNVGGWGFRFSAFFLEFSGSNVIDRDFTFGGITFPVNERVDSRIRIENYRFVTIKPIVNTDVLVLALQGGISWYSLDGTITSATFGSGTESGDVPIPVLGALLQAKVGMFLLEVDVTGLSVRIGGVEADLLELQASVGIVLFKIVSLRAGYRLVDVRGEASDFFVDATLDGFFVGASVSF